MSTLVVSRVVFLLVVCSLSLVLAERRDISARRYIIDLDQPPEERWAKVAEDYSKDFPKLLMQIEAMFPKELVLAVSDLAGNLDKYFPYPYADELRGIVKYSMNVTLGQVIIGNLLYDLTAYRRSSKSHGACTSIVASDSEGYIIHGRNLDYALSTLRDMTIEVQFKNRNNPNVFTGTTYAGFIGTLTGAKPGGFSISLDERNVGEWWENAVSALKEGSYGIVSLLIRDTLQTENIDFDSAVEKLSSSPLIAPCYLIVGGLIDTQGMVITRDRIAAIDKWYMDPSKPNQWYVLETNYDHWNKPPSGDNRRDPGIKSMNAIGRSGINYDTLFEVLSTSPILNKGTTYTTIMSPSSTRFFFNTTIRYF